MKLVYIEHEGGLFRGVSQDNPSKVWYPETGWRPYKYYGGDAVPQHWGDKVSEDTAMEMMAEEITRAKAKGRTCLAPSLAELLEGIAANPKTPGDED